eukprot:scaffold371_cov268-Chaetoceros_neogracile.AAC.20
MENINQVWTIYISCEHRATVKGVTGSLDFPPKVRYAICNAIPNTLEYRYLLSPVDCHREGKKKHWRHFKSEG